MSKVMISMPDKLLEEVDREAVGLHKRRSEFLKDLVLDFLQRKKNDRPVPSEAPREDPFQRLREFQFDLEPGETAEKLIREMRDSR